MALVLLTIFNSYNVHRPIGCSILEKTTNARAWRREVQTLLNVICCMTKQFIQMPGKPITSYCLCFSWAWLGIIQCFLWVLHWLLSWKHFYTEPKPELHLGIIDETPYVVLVYYKCTELNFNQIVLLTPILIGVESVDGIIITISSQCWQPSVGLLTITSFKYCLKNLTRKCLLGNFYISRNKIVITY